MNEQTHYYNMMTSSNWCLTNPHQCPCKGRGWFLSEVDTWHRCKYHGVGLPHPEDEDARFDYISHQVRMDRMAYGEYLEDFRRITGRDARSFQVECLKVLIRPEPELWVRAAAEVVARLQLAH